MNTIPDIAQLVARIDQLERRVLTLEYPNTETPAPATRQPLAFPAPKAASQPTATSIFPILGKAALGIAGAYLLRALEESTSLPKLAIAILAIAYAIFWLIAAARIRTDTWFPRVTYALLSAFILAPMLWELTLRFQILPPAVTAGILASYALFALTLTWKNNLASVFWIACTTTIVTSLILMIATRDLPPFLIALLSLFLAAELASTLGHRLNGRILCALATDASISILIFISSLPADAHASYPNIPTTILLTLVLAPLAVYSVLTVIRTLVQRQTISWFELTQLLFTFAFALYGILTFSPTNPKSILGVICILAAIAAYTAALTRTTTPRNCRVFATWAAGLFLLGTYFALSPTTQWIALSLAAITTTFLGRKHEDLILHGTLYLTTAIIVSGQLLLTAHALLGFHLTPPSINAFIIFVAALIVYAIASRTTTSRLADTIPLFLAASITTATGAALLVSALASTIAHPGLLALTQTLIACAAALTLAYTGSRTHRSELGAIAYTTLVLVAAKLLLRDLRQGHFAFIAASFVLYAATLVLVPRLTAPRLITPRVTEPAHEPQPVA